MLRQKWWKILGVMIMLYVLIGGLLTPLQPGIHNAIAHPSDHPLGIEEDQETNDENQELDSSKSLDKTDQTAYIDPYAAMSGTRTKVEIHGYNTNFDKAFTNNVFLKLDSVHLIKAIKSRAYSCNLLLATFDIPSDVPTKDLLKPATLIVTNDIDGKALLTRAINVQRAGGTSGAEWNATIDKALIKKQSRFGFPYRSILYETIRNTFFHVALWMAMFVLLMAGLYHAIMYLKTKSMDHDKRSAAFNRVAILYGILGLITGSVWAKVTWGTWWTDDVKLNMSAIAMLIYSAYLILRSSSTDFEMRARLSAAYSIFAFAALVPLILIIPRLQDSLHPGNGGNPALGGEDLDNTLRLFFYPSIISLILLGCWIGSLLYRTDVLEDKVLQDNE